jgi:hypothetical protein
VFQRLAGFFRLSLVPSSCRCGALCAARETGAIVRAKLACKQQSACQVLCLAGIGAESETPLRRTTSISLGNARMCSGSGRLPGELHGYCVNLKRGRGNADSHNQQQCRWRLLGKRQKPALFGRQAFVQHTGSRQSRATGQMSNNGNSDLVAVATNRGADTLT